MKKIKIVCNILKILIIVLLGIGCFHSGFEYAEALTTFKLQGSVWTLTPDSILLFTALPYVLFIGLFIIILVVLNKFLKEEKKNIDNKGE